MTRPDWNDYFLGIAESVAQRSDCRRARVGAVIVDSRKRIVSTGYVGTAPRQMGCLDGGCRRGLMTAEECPPGADYDNCISTHAEVNALLYSDRSRHDEGCMYVTRQPCYACYKVLRNSGLSFVKWPGGFAMLDQPDTISVFAPGLACGCG